MSAAPESSSAPTPTCPVSALRGVSAPDAVYRRPFGRPRSPKVRQEIARLDAQRDCQRIVRLLVNYEFPLDMQRSLEIALFHTYGSRSVARLLDHTGEFEKRGQKRYDDTRILITLFNEGGWDTDVGARAIAQMNHIHGHFRIPNEDFLFVLWTFMDFPIQWMREFGYRPLTPHECEAWFHYWSEIGRRMGLQDIPTTKAEFDAFVADYEAREFVPNEHSHRVARATLRVMENWLPKPLRPLVTPAALSLVPPQLLPAIGYAPPSPWVGRVVRGVLKARAWAKRYVSLEAYPTLLENGLNRTYPGNKFSIETMGPEYAHRQK